MMTLAGIGPAIAAVIGGGVLVNAAKNPPGNSFVSAMQRLERRLLASISVESAMPPYASCEALLALAERLPQATAFPLHGAPADGVDHSGSTLRRLAAAKRHHDHPDCLWRRQRRRAARQRRHPRERGVAGRSKRILPLIHDLFQTTLCSRGHHGDNPFSPGQPTPDWMLAQPVAAGWRDRTGGADSCALPGD
jgi:hypothetical protein